MTPGLTDCDAHGVPTDAARTAYHALRQEVFALRSPADQHDRMHRALVEVGLEKEVDAKLDQLCREWVGGLNRHFPEVFDVMYREMLWVHFYPLRPPRRMPSLEAIARYLRVEHKHPFCWRCLTPTAAETWREAKGELERAHVIDRVADGLDTAANLRPLCSTCHHAQPMFEAGQEAQAVAWFGEAWPPSS